MLEYSVELPQPCCTGILSEIIITGAGGFLGTSLVRQAEESGGRVLALPSPRQQGIDLASPTAADELCARYAIRHPQDALLIHAAALVDGNTPAALLANAAMAMQVAQWAKQIGIGFCV